MKTIEATLYGWSCALGIDQKTLKTKLVRAGNKLDPGKPIAARAVMLALSGDLISERIRKTRAEAGILETKQKLMDKEVVTMEHVNEVLRKYLGPVRQLFLSLPGAMAARVNPADPTHARAALGEWVDAALKQVRETK